MPYRLPFVPLLFFLLASLLAPAPLRPATARAAAPALSETWARLDALHARRDEPAARAEARRLADARCAEALVDLVLVGPGRGVETANEQQLARRNAHLPPPVQALLAVHQHVGGDEWIRDLE